MTAAVEPLVDCSELAKMYRMSVCLTAYIDGIQFFRGWFAFARVNMHLHTVCVCSRVVQRDAEMQPERAL